MNRNTLFPGLNIGENTAARALQWNITLNLPPTVVVLTCGLILEIVIVMTMHGFSLVYQTDFIIVVITMTKRKWKDDFFDRLIISPLFTQWTQCCELDLCMDRTVAQWLTSRSTTLQVRRDRKNQIREWFQQLTSFLEFHPKEAALHTFMMNWMLNSYQKRSGWIGRDLHCYARLATQPAMHEEYLRLKQLIESVKIGSVLQILTCRPVGCSFTPHISRPDWSADHDRPFLITLLHYQVRDLNWARVAGFPSTYFWFRAMGREAECPYVKVHGVRARQMNPVIICPSNQLGKNRSIGQTKAELFRSMERWTIPNIDLLDSCGIECSWRAALPLVTLRVLSHSEIHDLVHTKLHRWPLNMEGHDNGDPDANLYARVGSSDYELTGPPLYFDPPETVDFELSLEWHRDPKIISDHAPSLSPLSSTSRQMLPSRAFQDGCDVQLERGNGISWQVAQSLSIQTRGVERLLFMHCYPIRELVSLVLACFSLEDWYRDRAWLIRY
jgi:hypothetical protein